MPDDNMHRFCTLRLNNYLSNYTFVEYLKYIPYPLPLVTPEALSRLIGVCLITHDYQGVSECLMIEEVWPAN